MSEPARVRLIVVPWDSGRAEERMGRGPTWLIERGMVGRLTRPQREIRVVRVDPQVGFRTEIAAAFDLKRGIAAEVAAASGRGELPVVLSGNCNAAVGVVAGLGASDLGIIWLDAHGDCETPETTTSGYLDGMGLAECLGACWASLLASVPGFRPLPGPAVALLGARQVSDAERALIAARGMRLVTVAELRAGALAGVLQALRAAGVRRLYLHVDLDVHDPSVAPANTYAEPGGLFPGEVRAVIEQARAALPVAAAALASYDPSCDVNDRMLATALSLAETLVAIA